MIDHNRFQTLVELLNQKELDAVFLAPSSDLKYMTGLNFHPDSRLKGALVTREGKSFFLCPSLHRTDMKSIEDDIPILEWNDTDWFQGAFKKGLQLVGLSSSCRIAFSRGIEAGDMIDAVKGLNVECVNGFFLLAPMRSIKNKKELELMRKASSMNDKMMEALTTYIRPGIYERDIIKFIMNFHESHGGSPRVPCVASGINSGRAHYGRDNNRLIEKQDIVMVDSGGWYDGYSHDMTRTFFVGAPTDTQRKVYEIVLEAQLAAEEKVQIGAIPKDIDSTARDIITEHGYGEAFTHRLGHGIGMDGQESPYISQANETPLVEGNCFSIEPGIYLEGKFGVRIEDLVMLTESGREVINLFPKELTIL
ncbi:MAG: Xaa-Pro peptidase family protein [Aminobacterium sp.]|jgi:Xaa-Pro dipeptidase|uniref:M24 family metallopeptidase n=1 Tax=Aminobacterium sp. MB27-C1 TaxID=3070661 RepID=UPI001BCE8119|nr:Xaa-Pro peptidase family protein [Aminobacterium sp. MB27-C1]MDD2206885.1 Xaa-Pro peptidase family protein [Aminobacterium sp.]MDD3425431.1 Xaa-Pro peptidase family protein [Aminobacterium sp.]MDD3707932.1 Xaa-Pro peptidase family protein [Aminobacterium sp.]MDD4229458.1 Xaa-Pro peptidase family protein [Aminobacterium sp.]MDD4550994.1 Xaa-Pro peptidase family protein [Aminobacterium sp.]